MKLSVYSPVRRVVEDIEVREVTLTGSEGQIQVLPGHANMVGTLEAGLFRYDAVDEALLDFEGFISTGFFEVTGDKISVMGETLELASEIDVPRAEKALTEAKEAMKGSDTTPEMLEKYRRKIQRAQARMEIAKSRS